MKNIVTYIILLCLAGSAYGQKVRMKNDMVTIDEVQVYKLHENGDIQACSTLGGNEFMTIVRKSYEERNTAHFRPNGQNLSPTVKKYIYNIKFPKSGRDLYTDMKPSEIVSAVYKSGMIAEDGKINEEKLSVFIKEYNNENLKFKL